MIIPHHRIQFFPLLDSMQILTGYAIRKPTLFLLQIISLQVEELAKFFGAFMKNTYKANNF